MKLIPSREDILRLLDRLDSEPADALESDVLEFKPWLSDVKNNLAEAIEMAVCFANANGGMIVFGIKDKVVGRKHAIAGCERYDLDVWRRGIYQDVRPNLAVDIEDLQVPEGILLLVRIPKGPADVVYGTSKGIYKIRVGKNCMPLLPNEFQRKKVSEGIIDWSAEFAEGVSYKDLSPIEIAHLKNTLKARKPGSDLLGLSDSDLLKALGIIRKDKVTRAGVLFLCDRSILKERFPQHEVIYLYQTKETEIEKRVNFKLPLLAILEKLTDLISSRNPIRTIKIGLFHIDIPSYPEETFREAILNALCHRNYLEEGSIYVRHTPRQMVISNPGGFISGITPENILVHEPKQRNRHLAEILEKIGLVERAGIGRRRIFIPMLSFGKRAPYYEADEHLVKLTLNNGSFDERMATFIAKKQKEGFEFSLDHLLLLSYMREHNEIDVGTFSKICQRPEAGARDILERVSLPPYNLLERRGKKKGVTYYLAKDVAKELIGKVAYSKVKGIDKIRHVEMIKSFVKEHGSISNQECRQLLGLGNSHSAQVTTTNILKRCDFLESYGTSHKTTKYRLRKRNTQS